MAEICFTILQDRRWRVVGTDRNKGESSAATTTTLFQWEAGEDLSVVRALSRQFVPRPRRVVVPCTCLLCRDETDKKKGETAGTSDHSAVGEEQRQPQEEDESADSAVVVDDDDEEVRGLYLYCRLFYRKGPWFRIDDVYTRYYVPKKAKKEGGENDVNNDTEGSETSPSAGDDSAASKQNFFRPVSSFATSTTSDSSTTTLLLPMASLQ